MGDVDEHRKIKHKAKRRNPTTRAENHQAARDCWQLAATTSGRRRQKVGYSTNDGQRQRPACQISGLVRTNDGPTGALDTDSRSFMVKFDRGWPLSPEFDRLNPSNLPPNFTDVC